MTGPLPPPNRSFLGLDLIRFVAAMMVAMHHLGSVWWYPSGSDLRPAVDSGIALRAEPLRWGWVGVEIFFVLSGFVIAYSASNRSVATFARNRFLRLYPGAWICATLTLLLARWGTANALGDYGRSLILSPVGQWIDYVYWTLPIEIAFYVAVAAMLAMGAPLRRLGAGLVMWSAGYWLLRTADFATGGSYRELFRALDSSLGNLTLLPYGGFFGLGVLLWSMRFEGVSRAKLALSAIAMAVGLVAIVTQARFYYSEHMIGSAWRIAEAPLMWLTALGLMIAGIAFNDALWRWIGRWSKAIRTIGLATYPLYLLHQFIGHRIIAAIGMDWRGVAIALPIVTALAFAVVPVEKRLRELLYRPRSTEPASLP